MNKGDPWLAFCIRNNRSVFQYFSLTESEFLINNIRRKKKKPNIIMEKLTPGEHQDKKITHFVQDSWFALVFI